MMQHIGGDFEDVVVPCDDTNMAERLIHNGQVLRWEIRSRIKDNVLS